MLKVNSNCYMCRGTTVLYYQNGVKNSILHFEVIILIYDLMDTKINNICYNYCYTTYL